MSTNRFSARTLARAGAVFTVAGFIALGSAGVASAHVTASTPKDAVKGGYTKITLRVPNESPDAGTVKLELTLPAEYPLASVSTKLMPGWKAEVVKATLDKPVTNHGREITEAPRTITWTAEDGTRIQAGQFSEFDIYVGPLPENTDKLLLPTRQTYDNGEVVAWDAPPVEGGAEPERPAPMVNLVAKEEGGDHHGVAVASANGGDKDEHAAGAKGEDTTARYLGGAGLAVGALGLGFGAGALLRSRRTGKPAA